MKLKNIIVSTAVARAEMTVGEVFTECIRCRVPRLPFVDHNGKITGCISIRKTLQQVCIPDYVIAYADLLGDHLGCLTGPEKHTRQVLAMPADRFVLEEIAVVDSEADVVKLIAVMEKHDTNHVFVIDEGTYKGMVTIDGIAKRMLEIGLDRG